MRFKLLGVVLLTALSSPLVNAATVSYSGSFLKDNDVRLISASFSAPSAVTIRTYSYAGGVNGAGTAIPAGGFDTVISIFNGAGLLLDESDDSPLSKADPVTQQTFDVYYQTTLAAGTYTIALAQYDNFAVGPNLATGFLETDPAFTSVFGCSAGKFCDVTGANRTSNWALDVSSAATAVPEPGISALFVLGLSALGVFRKRLGHKA